LLRISVSRLRETEAGTPTINQRHPAHRPTSDSPHCPWGRGLAQWLYLAAIPRPTIHDVVCLQRNSGHSHDHHLWAPGPAGDALPGCLRRDGAAVAPLAGALWCPLSGQPPVPGPRLGLAAARFAAGKPSRLVDAAGGDEPGRQRLVLAA